ncbi:MAG TPA: TolC family protein [Paludibacteraceae bacterium]|nr:TolC family protein [Paludibacteraceae bacterium]
MLKSTAVARFKLHRGLTVLCFEIGNKNIPPTVTFLVLPTFAQQSTSEIVNLSLEDCIQLAYKKNNNLQITLLNESANQEIYKQSKLERLPNLNASLGETFTHSDSNGSNWNYDTYTP